MSTPAHTSPDPYRTLVIVFFYIITALFVIGTGLNFLFMFPFGDRLKIIMRVTPLISILTTLICMFSFLSPVLGVYMFYMLYHNGPDNIHFFVSNKSKP
ncbi:hypothetical protein DLEV_135 [Diachasmimorpha longicaudata entomopoxvirus]|uniref:Uncharacterized protein n=1 Tax=Diachasmimorpha longicaudata entomopoxvirus TaxID=109981 RepID=A0A7R5WNX4_9POXV|nr:hypothetical protein QKK69_gp135 [Diachasmimorpha longicaudata entomopoxvirus]AKS26426.1 hypothetical protein DLEV_135 [Diachasmimorpha longicaudata entomopoxvirus]